MGAWARAVGVLAAVVAADVASKALVTSQIQRGERENIFFLVDLVHVRNRGVAFGLLADGRSLVLILTLAALALLVVFFATHARRPLLWLPTGLLLGGAVGNLVDRIDDEAVTDFVDLPFWPAFNLADLAITAGVFALLYVLAEARP